MVFAVDFDGTIVEHQYPYIGNDVPGSFETLIELQDQGHDLILWTVRIGKHLKDAVDYCKQMGLEFIGVNENPDQKYWNGSPKAYAQIYIDDAALGCPLITPKDKNRRPYVDWVRVRTQLNMFPLKST